MNYKKTQRKINDLSNRMRELSDEEIRDQIKSLESRIKSGFFSQDVIVDAFAIVREVDFRILGMFPTDEQVQAALAIFEGNIVEVETGGGKSLIATMPLYLKALLLNHVFLVTANDYLARRDYEQIGKVYEWLGLVVADGTVESKGDENNRKKRKIYNSNIIFISSSKLGFDFLINGLIGETESKFINSFDFALIDEVDMILLDMAETPLLISGLQKVQSNYFDIANGFIQTLKKDVDYKIDSAEHQVWLTEKGIQRAQSYFALPDLLDRNCFEIYKHVILSLKAWHTLIKNKDYVVEQGQIKLLDDKNGRVMNGMKLQGGLHQAIEVKEGVPLTTETKVLASTTIRSLFQEFKQISGMSGTVKVVEKEFIDNYNLCVKRVKVHKKNRRIDHSPQSYVSFEAKIKAVLKKIQELYHLRRPQLVIAESIEMSELISLFLFKMGIPHNVLSAKTSAQETNILREAGYAGTVTISTSMTGRGTDIKLTPESLANGGLAVIITEKMQNHRIELQAKGRAGRQGEPGDSYSFQSLEDEVIKKYLQDRIQKFYDKHKLSFQKIRNLLVRSCFDHAQEMSEEAGVGQRKISMEYDEIVKIQKKIVDRSRQKILNLQYLYQAIDIVKQHGRFVIDSYLGNEEKNQLEMLKRFFLDYIDYNFKPNEEFQKLKSVKEKIEFSEKLLERKIKEKKIQINDDSVCLKYFQTCILRAIDMSWSDQMNALYQLKISVQYRSFGQKNPIMEFEEEAKKFFKNQQKQLSIMLLKNTMLSMLEIEKEQLVITFP